MGFRVRGVQECQTHDMARPKCFCSVVRCLAGRVHHRCLHYAHVRSRMHTMLVHDLRFAYVAAFVAWPSMRAWSPFVESSLTHIGGQRTRECCNIVGWTDGRPVGRERGRSGGRAAGRAGWSDGRAVAWAVGVAVGRSVGRTPGGRTDGRSGGRLSRVDPAGLCFAEPRFGRPSVQLTLFDATDLGWLVAPTAVQARVREADSDLFFAPLRISGLFVRPLWATP